MMFTIRDIMLNGEDSAGAKIIGVYAKIDRVYAIYRTEERVLVQFADDPVLGGDQRKLLAPLGPLRGEINGLIDGWRKSDPSRKRTGIARLRPVPEHDKAAKAALFDRRVADALAVALQGGAAEAGAILTAVKADIVEERTSVARTEYVLVAAGLLLLLVGTIALGTWLAGPDKALLPKGGTPSVPIGTMGHNAIGFAAAVGALGALFSIALAIRSRESLTDLQSLDNIIDAAMRMLIGAISAILLYCLIAAGYFTFSFGGASPLQLLAWQPGLAVVAFVAGFSERLVGNVLGRASLGAVSAASTNPVAGRTPQVVGGQPAAANERNPIGRPAGGDQAGAAAGAGAGAIAAVNDDEELSEGGHETADLADEALTADVELPEAVGGVERTS